MRRFVHFCSIYIVNILLLTSSVILFTKCLEDPNSFEDNLENTPSIQILSATTANDTTTIKIKLIFNTALGINEKGVYYNTVGNPSSEDKQKLSYESINNDNDEFTVKIPYLESNKKHYFKAFIDSYGGDLISTTFEYTTPIAIPPTIPCSLSNNTIEDSGTATYTQLYIYSGSPYSRYVGSYGYEVSNAGSFALYFSFANKPETGVYTTSSTEYFNNSPRNVFVLAKHSMIESTVNSGSKVYVENNGSTIKISFCSLPYVFYSSTFTCTGSFTDTNP